MFKPMPPINNKILAGYVAGGKPSDEILNFVDEIMNNQQFPTGITSTISILGPNGERIRENVFFHDAGDVVMKKVLYFAFEISKFILDHPSNLENEVNCSSGSNILHSANMSMIIPEIVSNLIIFWYAQKWLPPVKDFDDLIENEGGAERDPAKEYSFSGSIDIEKALRGLKPPQDRLNATENFMRHMEGWGGGRVVNMFASGGGNMLNVQNPVMKVIKKIKTIGSRVAKQECGLEYAQNEVKLKQAIDDGLTLSIYWTFKHWISVAVSIEEPKNIEPTESKSPLKSHVESLYDQFLIWNNIGRNPNAKYIEAQVGNRIIVEIDQILLIIAEIAKINPGTPYEDMNVDLFSPEQIKLLHKAIDVITSQNSSEIREQLKQLGSFNLWFHLGLITERFHWNEKAIFIYQTALNFQRDSDNETNFVNTWSNLGMLLAEQERYEEAENAYKSALELDPTLVPAWSNMGSLFIIQNRYEEALKAFTQLLQLTPPNWPYKSQIQDNVRILQEKLNN